MYKKTTLCIVLAVLCSIVLAKPVKYQNEDYNLTGGDYVISAMKVKKLSEDEFRRISQMLQYRRRER